MIISWFQDVRFCLSIVLFCFIRRPVLTLEFNDITSDVFTDGHYSGIIAAFGDFNADKRTDLFCIKHGGKTLEILLSNSSKPYLRQSSLFCKFQSIITGVIPGDFNGDSMMDVLLSLQDESSDNISIVFLWGSHASINCTVEIAFYLSGQPFVLDYNDDMIPDVMGSDESKKRCIWIASKTRNFTKQLIAPDKSLQPLRVPQSSAVVDLNNDLVSDVVITGVRNFELWTKNGTHLNFQSTIDYPKNAAVFGQSVFLDFNTDGKLDHLMAVCYDNSCKSSAVVIWNNSNASWVTLLNNFTYQDNLWGFPVNGITVLEKAALAITLRSGDFNMDGYPDFIVPLENKVKSKAMTVVILENVPCVSCPFGQMLKINWMIPGLDSISNIQLVAFYDIFEDGTMDILVSNKTGNEWHVHALKNMDTYDAYFIKVLVLSGLCGDCFSGHVPYGANQPGPMIMYNTTKPSGDPVVSCAVQMPQSAHFPLHLPYTVFGLGQTPNFVDHLTIAIPEMIKGKIHKREWTQIIPNSQMVVIPYPPGEESKWVNKLFLTPSHLVFMTCVALIGTCCFIALIIVVLHWKEKREDKKEKMQNAYRFPFDAM